MFEDETLDIACPSCRHLNSVLIREFEKSAEAHFTCIGCQAGVRVEAEQFRRRLDDISKEVEDLQRSAKQSKRRGRKDDFQI